MKVAALLLFIFNVIVALAAAAFYSRYSLAPVQRGLIAIERSAEMELFRSRSTDNFFVVNQERAAECAAGGGCAVLSRREIQMMAQQANRL